MLTSLQLHSQTCIPGFSLIHWLRLWHLLSYDIVFIFYRVKLRSWQGRRTSNAFTDTAGMNWTTGGGNTFRGEVWAKTGCEKNSEPHTGACERRWRPGARGLGLQRKWFRLHLIGDKKPLNVLRSGGLVWLGMCFRKSWKDNTGRD